MSIPDWQPCHAGQQQPAVGKVDRKACEGTQNCHGGLQSLISSVASALACQAMASHILQQFWQKRLVHICWHASCKEQMPENI